MKDEDYRFGENDDPRTSGDELIPDSEKEESLPFDEEAGLPVLEYLGEFKALIDACGQVSYFFNMKKYIEADVNKAKAIASAYQHDLRYYREQLNEWRVKAERSYAILGLHAGRFGFEMPDERTLLNGLAMSPDRRKAYKGYLNTCVKNREVISPTKLEYKYYQLLEKRMRR